VEQTRLFDRVDNQIVLATKVGDTMQTATSHLHQAMRQLDKMQFLMDMEEEVRTHEKRMHWKVIRIFELPNE